MFGKTYPYATRLIHTSRNTFIRECLNWIPEGIEGYGVATISRFLKIIGLFYKKALQKRRYSTKET